MNHLLLFFKFKQKMFRHRFRGWGILKILKVLGLSLLGLFFLSCLHWAFFRLLNYLQGVELIGSFLILKLLAMIFFTFFIMLVFSNFLTSFTTVYFARDLSWLMVKPLNIKTVFFSKFGESAAYASLMIVVVFIPFLLAYGQVKSAGLLFYLGSLTLILPFLLIVAALGTLISTLMMRIFPSAKTRDVFLALGVILGCSSYLFFRFLQPEKLINPDKLNAVIEYVTVLQSPVAKYLPSWWLCAGLGGLAAKKIAPFVFNFFLLWLTAGLAILLLALAADKFYRFSWMSAQETSSILFFKQKGFWRRIEKKLFSPRQTLLVKDIKTFFRDSHQWSQLLLLLAITIIYLFNIYKLPLDTIYLKSLISFLNIGMAGFVIVSVGLRFVFPLISLERECFYLLRLSPISLKKIIWTKFYLAVVPLLLLAVILVFISNLLLKVDGFILGLSFFTILAITLGITGLGVGMGAIFPSFKVENVAQIESSLGGIIYIVFSLFYIGLNLAILAWPVKLYFYSRINNVNFWHQDLSWLGIMMVLLIFLNLIVTILPLHLGRKALEKYEE
ncbi:MAG: hypothetical protein ABII74_09175 [Elusimicrobiota bacterium]